MVKLKTQEFFEMAFPGICFIAYGVLGYLVSVPSIFLVVSLMSLIFAFYSIIRLVKKKEKDDDLSLLNKQRAGYKAFLIGGLVVFLFIAVQMFRSYRSSYFSIQIDLRILAILYGSWMLIYYAVFRMLERPGEDYDED